MKNLLFLYLIFILSACNFTKKGEVQFSDNSVPNELPGSIVTPVNTNPSNVMIATPTMLSATAVSASQINLTWTDNSNNETNFALDISTDSNFILNTHTVTIAANTTSYQATNLIINTIYYFRLKAIGPSNAESVYSNITNAQTLTPTIAAPSNFSGSATSSSDINLTWNYPSGVETGFTIERATNSGFTSNFATTSVSSGLRSKVITNLQPSTQYYFRIKALTSQGNSSWVNSSPITTQALVITVNAPTNLTSTVLSSSSIRINWTDNATNETAYIVERAQSSTCSTATYSALSPNLNANANFFTDMNLQASTAYCYRVKAISGSTNSSYATLTAPATTQAVAVTVNAPTNLTSTVLSSSSIRIDWNDNAINESAYTVERAQSTTCSSASYSVITSTLALDTKTFTDTSLAPSTSYCYRVKATLGSNASSYATLSSAATTQAGSGAVTIPQIAWDNSSKDTVLMFAKVFKTPAPKISLYWATIVSLPVYTQKVFRKLKNDTTWTQIATPAATASNYDDTNVVVGTEYEYKIERTTQVNTDSNPATGFLSTGIEVPAVDFRGKILLFVESSLKAQLSTEVNQLINDLKGDGYIVKDFDTPSYTSHTVIKNNIVSEYNSDPTNVKSVLLLGNLAVPYSGTTAVDGHGDHVGAWPADTYFADVNGNWTDNNVNMTNGSNSFYNNIPGDGKFDQNDIPTTAELQVGRIYLKNMNAFWQTGETNDVGVYRRYLVRNHNFKIKQTVPQDRALIHDNFTGYTFAGTGWRSFSGTVGPDKITRVSYESNNSTPLYYNYINNQSYLWSYACGGGGFTQAVGIGNTWNFASVNTGGVFNIAFGSYFGDWNNNNNFLLAFIAGGQGLTTAWLGGIHGYFHHMGMGEVVGESMRRSTNNKIQNTYYPKYVCCGDANRQNALHGDPTLTQYRVAPATSFSATPTSTAGNIVFNWTASSESVLGYNVYEITNTTITKLNSSLITGTSFTSNIPNSTTGKTYSVRAVKLQTTSSGSYFNMSTGAILNR